MFAPGPCCYFVNFLTLGGNLLLIATRPEFSEASEGLKDKYYAVALCLQVRYRETLAAC